MTKPKPIQKLNNDPRDWIAEREKEIAKQTKEVQKVKDMLELFDDLTYSIDRWQNFRLHSAKVNAQAEDVDLRHACGCCNDSPVVARPYIMALGQRVYTVPTSFTVGEKGYNGGEIPLPGWRSELLNSGIQQCIIDKIESFFEANKETDDEEDEDELL